jgi:micrococcal nuclease
MKQRRKPRAVMRWVLFLAALAASAWAATRLPQPVPERLQGGVARVIDGDSFILRATGGDHEIRIAGIDAPEFVQPWGGEARSALHDLIGGGRDVVVEPSARDRHGRLVAAVRTARGDVATALVRDGDAWASDVRGGDPALLELQARARERRIGLWSQENPVPPAAWRAGQSDRNESPAE